MKLTIIGERLNSSRGEVAEALEKRDYEFIKQETRRQLETGAQYLDINAGAFVEREAELLLWLTEVIREVTQAPLSLDTTNPEVAEVCLRRFPDRIMLNSVTGEKSRLDAFIPLVRSYHCGVIVLCVNEGGLPQNSEQIVTIAGDIVERLLSAGIACENIYLDPALRPLSVDTEAGVRVLHAVTSIKQRFPEVHVSIGLSNVSFGLPARSLVNRAFAILALSHGTDTFILDPCDGGLMAALISAQAVLNQDEYCRRFLVAYREGKLVY